MTQEEITTGNELIIEFLKKINKPINSLYLLNSTNEYSTLEEMKFNTSWDMLMPIIDYIEDIDDSDKHYKWSGNR
jgi:hypothetical protein